MKIILKVVVIFSISMIALAHQDTVINIDGNGVFTGLPKEYQPARMDLNKWILEISNNKFQFPDCIVSQFSGVSPSKLVFASSWYHSGFFLPPYFTIELKSGEFSILFSMENLKPIDWLADPVFGSGGKMEYRVLDSSEICNLYEPKEPPNKRL